MIATRESPRKDDGEEGEGGGGGKYHCGLWFCKYGSVYIMCVMSVQNKVSSSAFTRPYRERLDN